MIDDTEERIRVRAYRLWVEEGRPEGRAADHWNLARELVAIEESQRDTLKPVRRDPETGEPIADSEPIEAVRNLGEFPTLTDQGEEAVFPDPKLMAEADEGPLSASPEPQTEAKARPKAAKAAAKAPAKAAAKTAAKPKRAAAKPGAEKPDAG